MKDLQVFKVVDALQGSPVSDTTVDRVRTVVVKLVGNVYDVAEVTINGYLAVSFTALDGKNLSVVLPASLASVETDSLRFLILSSEQTPYIDSQEILFTIGRDSKTISGTSILVQTFIRFLLMTKGTDRHDPSAGAGLLGLAQKVTSANLIWGRGEIARMHSITKSQIVERQRPYLSKMRPTEILRDAKLSSVWVDKNMDLGVRSVIVDSTQTVLNLGMRV